MSKHRPPAVPTAFALAVLALSAPPASATTIEARSIDEMVATADEIVVGEVVEVRPVTHAGRVATRVVVATEACYLGDPVPSIAFTIPGGRSGEYMTRVPGAGTYEVGEHVLVFLESISGGRWLSQSLAFGSFRLEPGDDGMMAVRDLAGLSLVRTDPEAPVAPDIDRAVFDFSELEALILEGAATR